MTILKEYRINNDLKQDEMANKLNCSLPSYRLYENGKQTIPHKVLLTFLKIRAREGDLELAKRIEELYEK